MERDRRDKAPDLPTGIEQGVHVAAGSARGFAMPAAITRRWEDAIRRTANDPAFRALAQRGFLIVRHMDRATMTAFVEQAARDYAALWRTSPWRR